MKVSYIIFFVMITWMVAGMSLSCAKLDSNNKHKPAESVSESSSASEGNQEKFNVITTKYNMSTSWYERSKSGGKGHYGDWQKDTTFKIVVKSDTINTVSKKTDLKKLADGTDGKTHDNDVIDSVSEKDTIVYNRFKNLDSKKDSSYTNGKTIFLFVDSITVDSDKSSQVVYDLSDPIPFVPRSDIALMSYKKYAGKNFEYTYSTKVEEDEVEFKMTCDIDISGDQVEVTINNEITKIYDTEDKKENTRDNDYAYVYGKFPILGQTVYNINTTSKRIKTFTGDGKTLISGMDKKTDQIAQGNIGTVKVEATLTSYKTQN